MAAAIADCGPAGFTTPTSGVVVVGVATRADWLRNSWDNGGPLVPDLPPGADLDSAYFYHVELRTDLLSMEEPEWASETVGR